MKGRWRYARCGEPKRSDTLSDEGQRPNVKEKRKLESRVQRQVARTVRRGAGRKGRLTDLARCLPYTIASNLLEANAVLSWQGSCQSAKRLEPLLCATIGHTPPVMRDNSCYRRHTCSRVASVHMCTRGRDQPVILGAQTAQPRELQIVGEQPGAVNAAYLSPSAYATVRPRRYGVEVRLST